MFFDLEKAYDTTWRYNILKDVHKLGLRGRFPTFIVNFLAHRTMQVRVRSTLSDHYYQVYLKGMFVFKVSKLAKTRYRYNQVPHLTQDTNGKVTKSQLDTTKGSQEVSLFPADDHKAHINRRAQRHSKRKTEKNHKISTKAVPAWNSQ